MSTEVEEAVALQKAGQSDAAERLYRRVLESRPDHAEANHNLGIISMQRGKIAEGVCHFRKAFEAERGREHYRRSYARSLVMCGQAELAAQVIADGEPPAADPAEELLHRGNTLTEQGRLAEAVEAFKSAIALNPALAEAYHHLGSLLAETGHVAQGFGYLMQRAELIGGQHPAAAGLRAEPPHKIKHDREQRAHLIAQGLIAEGTPANAIFHIGEGSRPAGSALNLTQPTAVTLQAWRTHDPPVVVVDEFLTRSALRQLRRYCAESTVWRRIYDAGYLGATPADGFACPLLAQITEEIAAVYAEILGNHAFRYLGGFKYDSELSTGTNIHADFSAINVNLYITEDEANSDPESGGLMIWDLAARDADELRRYNGSDAEIREHLRRSAARVLRVPHRANRAVFFKSSLFHKTDTCRFKEGYLNKRINVSFLFGEFEAPSG